MQSEQLEQLFMSVYIDVMVSVNHSGRNVCVFHRNSNININVTT